MAKFLCATIIKKQMFKCALDFLRLLPQMNNNVFAAVTSCMLSPCNTLYVYHTISVSHYMWVDVQVTQDGCITWKSEALS